MSTIAGWTIYMMWGVMGLMLLDFLVGFFQSMVTKSFSANMVLDYLKDILYYVFPLMFLMTLMPIDPTGWALLTFFYIGGIAVAWHYLTAILSKWRA